jgi:hypothetical protein
MKNVIIIILKVIRKEVPSHPLHASGHLIFMKQLDKKVAKNVLNILLQYTIV